ncbi:MAG: glutamine synthetase, partial [Candidatus Desulforudis sp.]|nr:glutamine synthetase [Desulforudis sp.]
DPAANPYLALAAIVAAGLDGIQGQIEPEPFINEAIIGRTDSWVLHYLFPEHPSNQLIPFQSL